MISVQGSGGGGEKITIGGIEIGGELKLAAKWQWVGEEVPVIADSLNFPSLCFGYKNEIHGTYNTTHKKLLNGVWVDDVSLPVADGSFCEDDSGNLYYAKLGKIYQLNGTEWTNILTISGTWSYQDNLIYDEGKLYYSLDNGVSIIDLNTLSVERTSGIPNGGYAIYKKVGKIFRFKGELYTVFAYYQGSGVVWWFSNKIYKYSETLKSWDVVGALRYDFDNSFKTSTPLVMGDEVYICSEFYEALFDGNTIKKVKNVSGISGTTFKLNGQYYLYDDGLFTRKKVLCLEV